MDINGLNNYMVNPNDDSIKDVRWHEEFFNMIESHPTTFDNSYLDLMKQIYYDKSVFNNRDLPDYAFDPTYVKDSFKVWDALGIRLNHINLIRGDFNSENILNHTVKEVESNTVITNPCNVPLEYSADDLSDCKAGCIFFPIFGEKYTLCKKITLPKLNRKAVAAIYAHEMTHMQMYEAGGGVKKINNDETLPILLEQIVSHKLDESEKIFNLIRNHRLVNLAHDIAQLKNRNDMNFFTKMKYDDYVISTIQGIDLANKYFLGDINIKREMIYDINRVFRGEIVTEDMLDKYESNYTEVPLKVKSLKRYK